MINGQNSNQYVDDLVRDLAQPTTCDHWLIRFWSLWGLAIALNAGLCLIFISHWPTRLGFPQTNPHLKFTLTASLWLVVFANCAWMSFLFTLPLSKKTRAIRASLLTTACLALAVILQVGSFQAGLDTFTKFSDELAIARGKCGLFVVISSIAVTSILVAQSRLALVIEPKRFLQWTIASSGCLAAFAAQLICHHESPAHVLLWHVAPFGVLVLTVPLAFTVAQKLRSSVRPKIVQL